VESLAKLIAFVEGKLMCALVVVAKYELTLFFVLLTAKKSHPDWFLLSQTSCLLVKRTKNKVSSHFATPTNYLFLGKIEK
jgi:hypothetical protein